MLRGAVPLCRRAMRDLVALCADREGSGGGTAQSNRMAFLDEADRGDGWPDRRCRLHVHPVQAVFEFVQSVAR